MPCSIKDDKITCAQVLKHPLDKSSLVTDHGFSIDLFKDLALLMHEI